MLSEAKNYKTIAIAKNCTEENKDLVESFCSSLIKTLALKFLRPIVFVIKFAEKAPSIDGPPKTASVYIYNPTLRMGL